MEVWVGLVGAEGEKESRRGQRRGLCFQLVALVGDWPRRAAAWPQRRPEAKARGGSRSSPGERRRARAGGRRATPPGLGGVARFCGFESLE